MAPKKKSSSKAKKPARVSAKKHTPAGRGKSAAAPARAAAKKTKSAGVLQPLVAKQPQSKQKAAVQHHMFLHEDDAWSLAYFNNNDLHSVERQLFG